MFYTLAIILLIIIVAAVIYLATLDGQYSIRRTQLIDADINVVFDKIKDLKSWTDWSPWLIHEPDTHLEYSENYNQEEGFYTWEGRYIGKGRLTHVKLDQPNAIQQKLEFIKPFKSICDVGFEFSEKAGKTEITWYMDGKMPFLFRFMTEKTRDMISKDYDFGLAMLKGILQADADHPVLTFDGEVTREPVYVLCEGFSGGVKAMEEAMKQGFPKLMNYITEQQGDIISNPLTAYHKSNPKTMQFVCDMAIPVAEGINAGDFQLKTLAGGRFYKVTLKGGYQFLELAWHSAMGHVCMYKLKLDKSRACLEVYENNPELIKECNELITTLYIAIK